MCKVYPIAATKIDWKSFNTLCEEYLGHTLSKATDKAGLTITDPVTFMAALDLENNHLALLSDTESLARNHVSFTIMFVSDTETMFHLQQGYIHYIIMKTKKGDKKLVIASGTLLQWEQTIRLFCSNQNLDIITPRIIMGACFDLLCKTAICKLWSKYKKRFLGDGTFVLEI
jgi:hypothetical protein